jgi:hypothetical protein
VGDLYFALIGLPILLQENRWAERRNIYVDRSLTHECGECGIMTEALSALKKISVMHVIKLGFAPVSFPPG